mgnify:CR=1 FL=1|jgi:hypothetical protein
MVTSTSKNLSQVEVPPSPKCDSILKWLQAPQKKQSQVEVSPSPKFDSILKWLQAD